MQEIRPDGLGGAWVKVIFDVPAHHDARLSEVVELDVYVRDAEARTVRECLEQARIRAKEIMKALSIKT